MQKNKTKLEFIPTIAEQMEQILLDNEMLFDLYDDGHDRWLQIEIGRVVYRYDRDECHYSMNEICRRENIYNLPTDILTINDIVDVVNRYFTVEYGYDFPSQCQGERLSYGY